MKSALCFLLCFVFFCVMAQEVKENRLNLPIFPGCERVKNPSNEVENCLSKTLTSLILEKIEREELNRLLKNLGQKVAYTKFKFTINKEGKISNLILLEDTDMNLFLHIKKAIYKINREFTSEPAFHKGVPINFNFSLPLSYKIKS